MEKPRIVEEAISRKKGRSLIGEIWTFFWMFMMTQLLLRYIVMYIGIAVTYEGGLPAYFSLFGSDFEKAYTVMSQVMANPTVGLFFQIAAAPMILRVIQFAKKRDNLSLDLLGYPAKNILRDYLPGYLAGLLCVGVMVGISVAVGALTYQPAGGTNRPLVLLFFVAFLMQGLSEEIAFRGYFVVVLARRQSLITAVTVSGIIFIIFHLFAGTMGWLGALNLFLFAVFSSIVFLKTQRLWFMSALHAAWNFLERCFGITISGGAPPTGAAVFSFTQTDDPSTALFHGGDYGLENGVTMTIVLAVGIAAALLIRVRRTVDVTAS